MSRRFGVAVAAALLAACSSGSTDVTSTGTSTSGGMGAGGDAGADGPIARTPMVHRPLAAPCTGDRPPGISSSSGAGGGSACMKDGDCTNGANGRCESPLGKPNICSYDACAADKDCGSASICECRNAPSFGANTCFHGNCEVDADCPGSFCSPSATSIDPSCASNVPQGSVGYFCHVAADECVDDADCTGGTPGGEPHCIFSADSAHWACFYAQCTD